MNDNQVYEALEIQKKLDIIAQATMELDVLRSNCKHDAGYIIGNFSYRPGSITVRRICNICQIPTGEEMSEEEYAANKETIQSNFMARMDPEQSVEDIKGVLSVL